MLPLKSMLSALALVIVATGATIVAPSNARAETYLFNGSFDPSKNFYWTLVCNPNPLDCQNNDGSHQDKIYLVDPTYAQLYPGPPGYSPLPAPEDNVGGYLFVNSHVTPATISQSFVDVPGQTLLVTGWVTGAEAQSASVTLLFNGVPETVITDPSFAWHQYQFFVTGTGVDTFTVSFLVAGGDVGLDNFSIVTYSPDSGATPLPAALPLFASGLGALGLLGWRRKRKVAAALTA